jgi:hypothetical protein
MPSRFIPCKLYVDDLTLTLDAQVENLPGGGDSAVPGPACEANVGREYFCREGLATGSRPAIRG